MPETSLHGTRGVIKHQTGNFSTTSCVVASYPAAGNGVHRRILTVPPVNRTEIRTFLVEGNAVPLPVAISIPA